MTRKIPPDPPTEEEIEEQLPDPPTEEEIEEIQTEIQKIKENWDPNDLPDSQERLVRDLAASGAPDAMIKLTAHGHYHDYVSQHAMPKHVLVAHAKQEGLEEIARRAKNGAYDP